MNEVQPANPYTGCEWISMIRRFLEFVLIAIVFVGAVFSWQTGRERSRTFAEYKRLERMTGYLSIPDPSKVYARALETEDPLHFAWRIYLPPKYKQIVRYHSGSSSSWRSDATEIIGRVRFREDERGVLSVYTRFSGGSGMSSIGDKTLVEFLREYQGQIQIEQLGKNEAAVIEPNQSAVLLKLTLPEHLHEQARMRLSPGTYRRCVPVLFQIELGPKTAKY
jgi:hypothetical protein